MSGEKELKTLDEEFDFYLGFTKPLVLRKSNAQDRAQAAMWIRTLIKEKDRSLRLDYLRLLLFALQKPDLIGPFKELPGSTLEALPKNQSILETISKMVEDNEQEELLTKDTPKVSTAVSHDLTEYSACQETPNFGVQCFYASSPISINQWDLSNQFLYPRKYSHGAEAWEQSLSQLYHSDLNMTSSGKNKTKQIMRIDCCKDRQRMCDQNVQEMAEISDDIQEHAQESDNRGPRSPWECKEKNSSKNQQGNESDFIWDKFSCLDGSYNIQPTTNMLEGCTLNGHGVALFQNDQIAMLLAKKDGQSKKMTEAKCVPTERALKSHIEEGKPQENRISSFSKPSYDLSLMPPGYENFISCTKQDPHPTKYHLKVDEISDQIQIDESGSHPNKNIAIQRANYKGQFPTMRGSEVKGKTKCNGIFRMQDMKNLFDQRIPEPNAS